MAEVTIAELRQAASERARSGIVRRTALLSYAEAAEVAATQVGVGDPDAFALWWVKIRLESAGVISREWEGRPMDLPFVIEAERARRIVARAEELWSRTVVASYERALAG